jgi:hypothetical protein
MQSALRNPLHRWRHLQKALAVSALMLFFVPALFSAPLDSTPEAVNGLFAGTAQTWLNAAINGQIRSGLTSRYLNQQHKLDAVFYAPEGDLIELHDTAEYDYQILDGAKTIHTEHAVVRYVVLMTPGADRWVIRQLQSVQQF